MCREDGEEIPGKGYAPRVDSPACEQRGAHADRISGISAERNRYLGDTVLGSSKGGAGDGMIQDVGTSQASWGRWIVLGQEHVIRLLLAH